MPRASRYMLPGYTYHLTQRCHNKEFLLRFAKDRNAYREWLRVGVRRFGVAVYGFSITRNHVHLLVHVDNTDAVSRLMQLTAGVEGRQYNRRKETSGAFWEDTFHCTIIENGRHLWNCMQYIDLNMVRAGVVKHPAEWPWCSYPEFAGDRQRYRILALDQLIDSLGATDLGALRKVYAERLAEKMAATQSREPQWTESLAVGSKNFVCSLQTLYRNRSRYKLEEVMPEGIQAVWTIKEPTGSYGSF